MIKTWRDGYAKPISELIPMKYVPVGSGRVPAQAFVERNDRDAIAPSKHLP